MADRDVGVLGPPFVQQGLQLLGRLGFQGAPARRRSAIPAREMSDCGVCQAWMATRLALRRAASSNAKVSAAALPSRPPMPTPTWRCAAPISSRTTTTGLDAWVAAYRLTEPRIIAANAPTPREPTTSISAPDPASVTASAGPPLQMVGVDQQVRGGLGRAGRRGGQGVVALIADDVGYGLVLRVALAADHPGEQARGRDDPQRSAAQHGLPGGPVHRPQRFLRAVAWRPRWALLTCCSSSPIPDAPGCLGHVILTDIMIVPRPGGQGVPARSVPRPAKGIS